MDSIPQPHGWSFFAETAPEAEKFLYNPAATYLPYTTSTSIFPALRNPPKARRLSGRTVECPTMRVVPSSPRKSQRRLAVVTLEVILVLPVFLIALMAVVEFGLLMSNEQYVDEASRAGAQVASQLNTISQINNGPVPADVLTAVARELDKIGVANYSVRLEHNINFAGITPVVGPVVELNSAVGTGPTNCPDPPAVALVPNRPYVRVTVCVRTTELTPNLLVTYGFDVSARVSDETTLRRYAL